MNKQRYKKSPFIIKQNSEIERFNLKKGINSYAGSTKISQEIEDEFQVKTIEEVDEIPLY